MKTYTSYDRVKAALEHKEPDKIPFDLGSAAVTGININALRSLRKYLDLPDAVTLKDKVTQIAQIEDDLIDALKIDIKGVVPNPSLKKGLAHEPGIENGYDRLLMNGVWDGECLLPGGIIMISTIVRLLQPVQ